MELTSANVNSANCSAESAANDVCRACQSTKLPSDTEPSFPFHSSLTIITRSGCANGNGRSTTLSTALKIAVVAPMPSARVSTAKVVNAGAVKELPNGIRDVLTQLVQPLAALALAVTRVSQRRTLGGDRRQVAKGAQRFGAGGLGSNATFDEFARAHLDVELEFLAHVLGGWASDKGREALGGACGIAPRMGQGRFVRH